jgi:hypothetical protein
LYRRSTSVAGPAGPGEGEVTVGAADVTVAVAEEEEVERRGDGQRAGPEDSDEELDSMGDGGGRYGLGVADSRHDGGADAGRRRASAGGTGAALVVNRTGRVRPGPADTGRDAAKR